MEEQMILFERLKWIKDYWVYSSVKRLDDEVDVDLETSECNEEFETLRTKINTEKSKDAYKKTINNAIEGVLHSILVMFDGGDSLTDKFNIDIINADTKESLKEESALHEEFIWYLMDAEEGENDNVD